VTGLRDEVYERLPGAARSAAVNLAGVRTLLRKREWDRCLASAVATEHWPPETQRRYVTDRLAVMLRHAVATVPRYRGMGALVTRVENARPEGIFEALAAFPAITKQDILDQPEAFLSSTSEPRSLRASRTSGTTGTPLNVLVDQRTLAITDAMSWRRTVWAGYGQGDWIARLVGDRVVPLRNHAPRRIGVTSLVDKRLYLSTYHLSARNVGLFVEALARRKPAFVMGYPSALLALCAMHGRSVATSDWRPKAVLFSSEPLLDHQRRVLETSFAAPCRGFYGCAERVVSAAQCEHGTYHLSLLDGYLEGQFSPVHQGTGQALVTTLENTAMPLIRYAIGDTLHPLGWVECECGRTLPAVDSVVTKAEDCVRTPSGRIISPSVLTWAFKDVDGLVASQIAQVSDEAVEIRVVCADANLNAVSGLLRRRLAELLFGEMAIRVVAVPELTATAAAKTRFVVDERSRVQ
jgi:phenylacetate-CoA ligase